MSTTMKVVAIQQHGGIEQMKLDRWPVPKAAPGQALVEIEACGLNYMDVFVLHGMPDLPTKLPRIPGGDIAGTVREVGKGVSEEWLGKRVVGFPRFPGGGGLGGHGHRGLCGEPFGGRRPPVALPHRGSL